MAQTTVRVTARGEFGQLQQGLKGLQRDLNSVLGEIDKGARKGGFFDQTNLRALQLYRNRFKDAMQEMEKELQKQNNAIDSLHKRMVNSSEDERKRIQDVIKAREKELDVIRKQLAEAEKLYGKRIGESQGYTVGGGGRAGSMRSGSGTTRDIERGLDEYFRSSSYSNSSGLGKIFGQGGMLSKTMTSLFSGGMGLMKGGLALAGIGGIGSVLSDAYNQAYNMQVGSLDTAQRIRGTAGFSGSNTGMYSQVQNVGMQNNLGYTPMESWQLQDVYSRLAGTGLSPSNQYSLQAFARGYGLDSNTVGSYAGQSVQLGHFTSASQYANSMAGLASSTGMNARVEELMQSSNALLSTINTTLKDGQGQNVLAYAQILDKIGLSQGMHQLTGASGAQIVQGLGGVYSPSDSTNWRWLGISALQRYDPKKYGKMGYWDLQQSFEDGLNNPDNLPAMGKMFKQMSGGNSQLATGMLQQFLQQGGYNATYRQASQLWQATNGLSAFGTTQAKQALAQIQGGNASSQYDSTRAGESGQGILSVNAQYEKSLEGIGNTILSLTTKLKSNLTSDIDVIQKGFDQFSQSFDSWFQRLIKQLPQPVQGDINKIGNWIQNNPTTAVVGGYVASKVVKGGYSVYKGLRNRAKATSGANDVPADEYSGVASEATTGEATGTKVSSKLATATKTAVKAGAKGAGAVTKDALTSVVKGLMTGEIAPEDIALPPLPSSSYKDYQNNDELQKIMKKNPGKYNLSSASGVMNVMKDLDKNGYSGTNFFGAGLVNLFKTGSLSTAFNGSQNASAYPQAVQEAMQKFGITVKDGQITQSKSIDKLQKDGNDSIDKLQKDGNTSIDTLQKSGTTSLDDMNKKSQKFLSSLDKNGNATLSSLEKNGGSQLEKLQKNGSTSFTAMSTALTSLINSVNTAMLSTLGQDTYSTSFGSVGSKGITSSVKKYDGTISKYASQYGIPTSVIEAIMQQESGGQGGDPMQSSESIYGAPGLINDPTLSIQAGVNTFESAWQKSKGNLAEALSAYNMGNGLIDYVNAHGGYSQANVNAFSQMMAKKNGTKGYGDPLYAQHVMQYMSGVGGSGGGILSKVGNWFNNLWGDVTGTNDPTNTVSSPQSLSQTINVNLNVTGSGAQYLSQASKQEIQQIAEQVFNNSIHQQQQRNP